MTKKFTLALFAAVLLAGCQPQVTDDHIKEVVEKYIQENPDKVIAALRGAKGKGGQQAQQDPAAVKKVVATVTSGDHAVIGDPNSKNVVIEFYDYNCGFCKKALDTVMKLANEDKAKVVLVELPVLGPSSEAAAKASAIVNKLAPSKFIDFHRELLTLKGHVDDATILTAVKHTGISEAKFKEEMAKPEYDKLLDENMATARSIGLGGTPSFIVNDQVVRGAMPYETFKAALK
jgi:protein-disulfide isomerase